jgi:hypothetical protein
MEGMCPITLLPLVIRRNITGLTICQAARFYGEPVFAAPYMALFATLRRLLIGKDYGASCLTIPAGYISGQEAL